KFPTSFPDGTSQTIFFGEGYGQIQWPGYPYSQGYYIWRSWWRYTSHQPWYDPTQSDMWSPDYIAKLNYNPPFQTLPPPALAVDYLPQALSTSGMSVGMGDGSARLVNANISPASWYAANTPNAGDVMGVDW